MKKISIICLLQLLYLGLFAQNKEVPAYTTPTFLVGFNYSMPLWAIAFKGLGAEVQLDYRLMGGIVHVCAAAGATNYANMGLTGMKNYNSHGQHVKLGLSFNKSFATTNKSPSLGLQLLGYWASTNETGIWNTDAQNVAFWQNGYYFDVKRQARGLEIGLILGWNVYKKHNLLFKNFYNVMEYDKRYFPLASISGAGYLLSSSNTNALAVGIHLYYFYCLY